MSEEELKEENFKLKKQLKLNHRLAKIFYDKFKESLTVPQETDQQLDDIMKKLTEDYNKLMD